MARTGRTLESEVRPVIDRFVVQLARILERHIALDLKRRVLDEVKGRVGAARRARGASRPPVRCYYPGCPNVAAPRFGMFCAALHKNLGGSAKARYRSQRRAAALK